MDKKISPSYQINKMNNNSFCKPIIENMGTLIYDVADPA